MSEDPPREAPPWLDAAGRHPRVLAIGRDDHEQRRVSAFATDLARWLWGAPRQDLAPLARVVTLVAGRELRDARLLCGGRPLLAVEAAARATEALWPLLRWTDPPEGSPEAGSSETGGDGAAPTDPAGIEAALAALAEDPAAVDDPELAALAARLAAMGAPADPTDAGTVAAGLMEGSGGDAANGALEADEVARHLEGLLPGVGWSNAPGELERSLLDRLDALAALMAKRPELRKIAEQLGRLESESRRKGRSEGGREEVAGVRLSGDITLALPSEIALLADADTEDLFHQRWIEHRLVSLELIGRGDEGRSEGDRRGPIIACIDTSASMEGEPELMAKAFVLGVCRVALPQGRVVHLLLFGGPGEQTEIRVRRGHGGLEGLLDFLQMGFHGGTDFDGPLMRAVDLLEERELRQADLLVVTDGLGRAAPNVVQRVSWAREELGARLLSVVIGREDTRSVDVLGGEVRTLPLGG